MRRRKGQPRGKPMDGCVAAGRGGEMQKVGRHTQGGSSTTTTTTTTGCFVGRPRELLGFHGTVQYRRQTHLGELSELVRQRCGGATTASVADVGESTQGGATESRCGAVTVAGVRTWRGKVETCLLPKRQRSVLLLACLPVCLFVPIVEARGRWVHEQVAERSEAAGSPNSGRRVRFDWWLERD